jgi:hypothetical protein
MRDCVDLNSFVDMAARGAFVMFAKVISYEWTNAGSANTDRIALRQAYRGEVCWSKSAQIRKTQVSVALFM